MENRIIVLNCRDWAIDSFGVTTYWGKSFRKHGFRVMSICNVVGRRGVYDSLFQNAIIFLARSQKYLKDKFFFFFSKSKFVTTTRTILSPKNVSTNMI